MPHKQPPNCVAIDRFSTHDAYIPCAHLSSSHKHTPIHAALLFSDSPIAFPILAPDYSLHNHYPVFVGGSGRRWNGAGDLIIHLTLDEALLYFLVPQTYPPCCVLLLFLSRAVYRKASVSPRWSMSILVINKCVAGLGWVYSKCIYWHPNRVALKPINWKGGKGLIHTKTVFYWCDKTCFVKCV